VTTENFPFDWANLESYRDSFSFTSTIWVVLVFITKVKKINKKYIVKSF